MPAPKKPAKLLLLNGRSDTTDAAGRPVDLPPPFNRGAPEAPADLSPEARAEWDRIVPGLDAMELLKPEDRAALVHHCECWAAYQSALADVRENGISFTNQESGVIHKNPAQSVVETMGTQLRNTIAMFGLSPAAERNVSKAPAVRDDSGQDPFGDSALPEVG